MAYLLLYRRNGNRSRCVADGEFAMDNPGDDDEVAFLLRRWAKKLGHDPKDVEVEVRGGRRSRRVSV